MDGPKISEVIARYRKHFDSKKIQPQRHRDFLNPGSSKEAVLAHCYYMINKIDKFIEAGKMDKAFRWLDFVQGVLLREKEYTIEELRDHKRPDKE